MSLIHLSSYILKGIVRVIPTSPKEVRVRVKETKERGKIYKSDSHKEKRQEKQHMAYKINKKPPSQIRVILSNPAEQKEPQNVEFQKIYFKSFCGETTV